MRIYHINFQDDITVFALLI